MYELILVRYGEMTLKKKNYYQFLNRVNKNIKNKCRHLKNLTFFNTEHRFYIYLNGEDHNEVIKALNTVVGLSTYSLCKQVKPDFDEIAKEAILLLKENEVSANTKFKVETNRGNKNFSHTSIQISQEVAKRILRERSDLIVDVHHPAVTLYIDLRSEGTYIFLNSIKGLGGYPSGTSGNGLLMISGGIDSPVAGFLTMKKGVNLTCIHYTSPPYTSDMSLQKVVELVEQLAKYSVDGNINLLVVPFTKIQERIQERIQIEYLVTIMRRVMYQIADQVARSQNISILVNGESIGQVASQTLESMMVVNEVTTLPIIRPLAIFDKNEIIKIAREIQTFDISIRPYEDCCTVFVPEHPIIKPNLEKVKMEETKCELHDLIQEAILNVKTIKLNCFEKYSVFESENAENKFEI